jgi:simple sugar transport system permease protein
VAIAIAIVIFILMNKTTLGYELKACGNNKNAAKYAGMNEKRNIMLSMALAGGLAAIGASLYYLNGGAELAWNTYSKLPDNGFNGIPVALLASNNPLGVIFSSVFLRYIDKGGYNLAGFTAYNEYVSDLIIAVIIYFAGFSKLIKDLLSGRGTSKEHVLTKFVKSIKNLILKQRAAKVTATVSDENAVNSVEEKEEENK